MINLDVTEKDIQKLFQYIEAIDKKNDFSIPEILQRKKRAGRKPIDLSLIENLQAKSMNDVAIYVALYLSKQTSDKWSIDDITSVLESKNFIDETLIPLLTQENNAIKDLTEEQKKELAQKILVNIIQNEKETIETINDFVKSKKTNSIFIHLLSSDELEKIKNITIESLKICSKILKSPNDGDYISYFLNHDADENSNELTYIFMNKLLGSYKSSDKPSLLTEIKVAIDELNEVMNDQSLNKIGRVNVEKYLKVLTKSQTILNALSMKNILWPQANNSINDINSLELYFQQIEDERPAAIKTINKYKKMKNSNIIIDKVEQELTYDDVISLLKDKAIKEIQNQNVLELEGMKLNNFARQLADKITAENPKIIDVFEKEGENPDIEIPTLLVMMLKKYSMKRRGRPTKEV